MPTTEQKLTILSQFATSIMRNLSTVYSSMESMFINNDENDLLTAAQTKQASDLLTSSAGAATREDAEEAAQVVATLLWMFHPTRWAHAENSNKTVLNTDPSSAESIRSAIAKYRTQ